MLVRFIHHIIHHCQQTLRLLHAAARLVRGGRWRHLKIQASWPWGEAITAAWQCINALRKPPEQRKPSLLSRKETPRNPGHPARQPGAVIPRTLKSRSQTEPADAQRER